MGLQQLVMLMGHLLLIMGELSSIIYFSHVIYKWSAFEGAILINTL